MKFISLFSGIGGMDLGLQRAGMTCVAQVEIDDYATRVLAKHWPDVPRFRDVHDVGRHNLPACDLICGGFPCQDISNAGKRAGIDGERSGLWSEYTRIVGELRPRYVLVENVAALLGRGIGRVLSDLSTLGYDAEWECIPAVAVGAPHIRDRIFILAYPNSPERWPLAEVRHESDRDHAGRPEAPGGLTTRGADGESACMADAVCFGRDAREQLLHGRQLNTEGGGWWATEPNVGRVAHGIPARVDRLRGLGNAVVPQLVEYIGRQIIGKDTNHGHY